MMRTILVSLSFLCLWAGSVTAQPPAKIPILFDFDIGEDIDDTFALATILASPELELRGVTTVGHDPYKRAQMAFRFLTAVGRREVPVAAGFSPKKDQPLAYWQVQYGNHASVYFRDPKPAKEKAPEFLYKHLKEKPGELTIVAVGPLTNIAKLIETYPDSVKMIKRLVIMGGSVRRGHADGSKPQPEWNIVSDVKAAQTVFKSGIPLVVAPLDATAMVRLDAKRQKKLFDRGSLLTLSVQALVQLWKEKNDPILYDPVAVTLVHTTKFCPMENLHLVVDDKGFTKVEVGKPANASVAMAIKTDEFLDWLVDRLINAMPPAWPTMRITNESKMVPRGGMPNRVHVFEDFETDIEKRWWLAGRITATQTAVELLREKCKAKGVNPDHVISAIELMAGPAVAKDFARTGRLTLPGSNGSDLRSLNIRNKDGKMVPFGELAKIDVSGTEAGNQRALRGVLTQDFDDRQGETRTLYTAVVFNPVPGPPMGKKTQLSFRYYLKGTDTLRVQLYSLTNGYHRCLMLKGLEQGKWLEGNVDMTQMRKPDGTGGPLAENERIDDIQFYADPRAELLIDDIVLYDAAVDGEKRPFPKRFLFTAWFDSGKQGKEWPGVFEIAPKMGYFWNAAKAVPHPEDKKLAWIKLDLRGERPIGDATSLSFRYKLAGADEMQVTMGSAKNKAWITIGRDKLPKAAWSIMTLDFSGLPKGGSVREIEFAVPAAAQLLIDDVLLYEPGKK